MNSNSMSSNMNSISSLPQSILNEDPDQQSSSSLNYPVPLSAIAAPQPPRPPSAASTSTTTSDTPAQVGFRNFSND